MPIVSEKPKAKRFSLKTIKDSGIVRKHSNGGRNQEIIYKNPHGEQFRILIHSESYSFQSYARLYKWVGDKGWKIITSTNPKGDYGIDISDSTTYSPYAFDRIIADFRKLIKEFS